MANLLQLQKGCKTFGAKKLFDEAQFSVNEGEHIGVIGPNGAGKTTLFRILTGQETLDSGQVIKANNLRLGYLAQHDHWGETETVEEYLEKDSVTPIWELKSLGRKLGLSDEMFRQPVKSLSGGYRMRCKLLYLIGQEPNLMLLDEPTNYLDLETTLVLENFLQGFKGAFLLISHDREFLRRTTDHVLEVEQGEITKFNGNLDDYFEQKELLRTQLEARAMSIAEKRREILEFVSRFGAKASKARQAQSRLKALAKMETIELKPLPVGASIQIPPPKKAGKSIVALEGVNLGYGEKIVLKNINFELLNGDHVAVVGLNGAGKSTFLKALAQKIEPLQGQIRWGYQVQIGYYAQHVTESLDPRSDVITEMTKFAPSQVTRQEALNMAGSLLFSGDDIYKDISVLSGGEKSRVAMGQILLMKAPCLILDEPTNHLDFQTVEALTQALNSYEGTVVVVSHDRSFIRRVGSKILEVRNGELNLYPGTYDEYVWSLEKGVLAERDSESGHYEAATESPKNERKKATDRESRRNLEKQLKQAEKNLAVLEKKMAEHEIRIKELNNQIAEKAVANLWESIGELENLQKSLEALEEEWISSSETVEKVKGSIQNIN